jgi:hypothetical protein
MVKIVCEKMYLFGASEPRKNANASRGKERSALQHVRFSPALLVVAREGKVLLNHDF